MPPAGKALLYCAGGGIGDSLVASLVARALRGTFERVDALTLPAHAPVLQRVPDVDDVAVDEGDERALAAELERNAYDACVVTWATRADGARAATRATSRCASGRRGASTRSASPTASSCAAKTAT